MKIRLIGYRGTGKTTTARLLAQRLGSQCFDSDAEIERQNGQAIRDIFAAGGEGAFRELEAHVVARLCNLEESVVSLGGGAVLREDNRQLIQKGVVVWLQADPDTIRSRMLDDPNSARTRPPLTAAGGCGEIEELLERRTPLYRQLAHVEVDTTGKTPEQVVEEIVSWLQQRNYDSSTP